MRKYTTEFVGTGVLVFTIICAVRSGSMLAPLAIGAVLAAIVFAGGHVSGAHYNPAVTLAVWLRGRLPIREVPAYLAAQLLGAAAGAGIGRYLAGAPATAASPAPGRALVAELAVTFVLSYVVLNVATSKDHPNNSFYGLAIGFTVLAGAVAVGGISGGVFNPAVALGVATGGLISWSSIWIYPVANLAGGALAALLFRTLNPEDLTAPQPGAEEKRLVVEWPGGRHSRIGSPSASSDEPVEATTP